MKLCLLPSALRRWLRERKELAGIPTMTNPILHAMADNGHRIMCFEQRMKLRAAEEQEMEWEDE